MEKLQESGLASPAAAKSATIHSDSDSVPGWLQAILDLAALEEKYWGSGLAVMARCGAKLFLFWVSRRQLDVKPRVQAGHD